MLLALLQSVAVIDLLLGLLLLLRQLRIEAAESQHIGLAVVRLRMRLAGALREGRGAGAAGQ